MSVRKSSHGTIFLIVSSGSPRALIASSLRSTSKKPFCPITRPLHPPMTAHGHRVRFVATWREEFFEVPYCVALCLFGIGPERSRTAYIRIGVKLDANSKSSRYSLLAPPAFAYLATLA